MSENQTSNPQNKAISHPHQRRLPTSSFACLTFESFNKFFQHFVLLKVSLFNYVQHLLKSEKLLFICLVFTKLSGETPLSGLDFFTVDKVHQHLHSQHCTHILFHSHPAKLLVQYYCTSYLSSTICTYQLVSIIPSKKIPVENSVHTEFR